MTPLKSSRSVRRVQLALYPVARLASVFVVRSARIELRPEHVDRAVHSYVLVGNHQSGADWPVMAGCLPARTFWRLSPIWGMFYNTYFDIPWMLRFNLARGTFPSHPHPRYPYGLAAARALTAQRYTQVIFPEGQRALPGEIQPRRGVIALAEPPHVRVIPIHLQWHRGRRWRWVDVAIESPIDIHGMSPQEVMDVVYALPFGPPRRIPGLLARVARAVAATRSGAPARPATPPG